jgi:hypothetical protein
MERRGREAPAQPEDPMEFEESEEYGYEYYAYFGGR